MIAMQRSNARVPAAAAVLFAALLLTLHVGLLSAADQSQSAINEARRLRDSRSFAEAIEVLERHLRANPEDREALQLHAQTLYWLKQHDRARAVYAAALARHPDDETLRLDYARMLADTGELRGAVRLLEEHRRDRVSSADADARLGTYLYWSGDLTDARNRFVDALKKDPTHQSAAQQLLEIDTASSSWLSLAPSVWRDDQPLDRAGVAFEVGWFATPLLSLAFRSQPDRYAVNGSRTLWKNEAELVHIAPAARLETRVAAGVLRRPGGADSLHWTARGELALRVEGGVTVRGRIERTPYVNTVASLDTPITSDNFAGVVQWNHPRGWLAEAAVQHQRFADANHVRGAYVWALAPLAGSERTRVQAGYSLSAADADEDRFVLAHREQSVPPADPQFDLSGIYHPYHTPARSLIHSVIGAMTAGSATGLTFRGSGSYGFRAHEDATVFFPLGTEVGATTIRRGFRPWTARASLEVPASRAVRVSLQGESGRTAYYHWTSASVHLLVRLLPPRTGRLPAQ